jgi:hypothetical protein
MYLSGRLEALEMVTFFGGHWVMVADGFLGKRWYAALCSSCDTHRIVGGWPKNVRMNN